MSTLAECDGQRQLRLECDSSNLPAGQVSDLGFCECNLCQIYTPQVEYENVVSPPLENAMVTTVLRAGDESNHTLCLNHWTFFKISTAAPSHTQSWQDSDVRSGASTITAQFGSQPDNPQQLVLTLDTAYDETYERFTTVDAFIHLSETLPKAANGMPNWFTTYEPQYPQVRFTPGDPPDTSKYITFDQRDSFTYTIGYDELRPSCRNESMPSYFYMAVRCGSPFTALGSWNRQDTPCRFRVRYVLIPQQLGGGDVLGPLPMQPLTTHAYSVMVGNYDVIRFAIRRIGENLTYSCQSHGTNCLINNGGGLVGTVHYAINMCPTRPGGSSRLLSNDTAELRQEWFCTSPGDEGRYYVAVRAAETFDASGPNPGYVLPNGQRPTEADALEPAPGRPLNRLKPARGYYTISVLHRAFQQGPIMPGEVRIGCVSYGQMRRFSVVTSGPADASLFVNVSRVEGFDAPVTTATLPDDESSELDRRAALSSLYVRRNRGPTVSEYDVAVHAPDVALSTSPCNVDEPYEYHIATHLADEMRATVDGLTPTLFELRPRLFSASGPTYGSAQWARTGQTHVLDTPFSAGGGGHVCCGQFRYYALRGVPADVEPVVTINISLARRGIPASIYTLVAPPAPIAPPGAPPTAPHEPGFNASEVPPPPMAPPPGADGMGGGDGPMVVAHAQGLFLKRGTCPTVTDVRPDRSGCLPEPGKEYSRCAIAWLVRYDGYSGAQSYLQSTVGAGGFAPLSAEGGPSDWYIGVQALHDEPAEYTLRLSARARPRVFRQYACNRLLHFCPSEIRVFVDADGDGQTNHTVDASSSSAAPASRWAGSGAASFAGVMLACTLRWLAPGRAGRRRR